MKRLLLAAMLGAAFTASAQNVGINTNAPKATLDVVGTPADAAKADGLIPPRLTRAELIAKTGYGADQTGAIVFVTDLSGTPHTATAGVLHQGHYYFNGSAWRPMSVADVRASGYVNASVAVTLGNLSARMPANSSLELKFSTATSARGSGLVMEGATVANYTEGLTSFTAETWKKFQGFNFGLAGAVQQIFLNDVTASITYRITMIVGGGFNGNFISIERLN